MDKDFNIILKKLDSLRKKYYLNQFLRGILIAGIFFIFTYLVLSFSEYVLFMSSTARKIIFLSFILFLTLFSFQFVFVPLFKLLGWKGTASEEKINNVLKERFPEIRDKLINAIELNKMDEENYSESIIAAAISQKSKELKIFDFKEAVKFRNLIKILVYFLLSFVFIGIIYTIDKSLLTEPGSRIIHYNQKFVRPSKYEFYILNDNLTVKKGKDFKIKVSCRGKEIPSIIYVNIEGNNFVMKNIGSGIFEYDLSSLINDIHFHFTDLKFSSENYVLKVMPTPVINNLKIEVDAPEYTGIKRNILMNVGDMEVLRGTKITWNFNCFDTDSLIIRFKGGTDKYGIQTNKNNFVVSETVTNPLLYDIQIKNRNLPFETVMSFKIEIAEDLYPEIELFQNEDSINLTQIYFKGKISDDFGFSELSFHLDFGDKDSVIKIPFNKGSSSQDFYFSSDLRDYKEMGNSFTYYFSVKDNDYVRGPKTTVSESFHFAYPKKEELEVRQEKDFDLFRSLIKESEKITGEIKKNLKDLQLNSLNEKSLEWDKLQKINEVATKKDELENILNQIEKLNRDGNNYQNTFSEKSEEIRKKQEMIQKLLDNVMTEELKKLMDEFRKLADDFNSKKFNDLKDKMDINLDDLSKQLDRNLEMLKRMKIEQRIEEIISQLEDIALREENTSIEILNNKNFEKERERLIDDLNEIKKLEENIKKIQKENNELKKPMIFDEFNNEFRDIIDSMKKTEEELNRKSAKNSSTNFRENSERINGLVFSMKQMLKANMREENGENIETLKTILKNLLFLSLEQEKILGRTLKTSENDPDLRSLRRDQKIISEQSTIIKDSLYALARRSPQLGSIVNQELIEIEMNLSAAMAMIEEGNIHQSTVNQRYVMTSANNLTLFLSEIMKKMEEEVKSSEEDSDDCKNGKGTKMSMLKNKAEGLRQQLKDIIEKLKNDEGKNLSKEMSESLMQHEIMQQMLRELLNGGQLGKETVNQIKQVDQLLEQNRKEIMNKRINQSMIQRQNEIMSRLLEAEKSEMEKDQDNKRESETADKKFYSNPALYFKKNEKANITLENLQRNSLKLSGFYLNKQRVYLEKFNVSNQQ